MRLIPAEILKMRRRTATYVILVVPIVLTAVIYLIIGRGLGGFACELDFGQGPIGTCIIEFPAAYALMNQFAFGLGGILAIVYAAAIAGADWNWGVLRNIIARGESRARYILSKAAAIALVLGIGVLLVFGFAFLMTYVVALINNIPVANPFRGNGLADLVTTLAMGFLVVLERAALGFAVAVVLRSQLAGAVVGVVLFVGEMILTTFLTFLGLVNSVGDFEPGDGPGAAGFQILGPEWYQYLPVSIGNQVLSHAPGTSTSIGGGGIEGFFLRPVPLEQAVPGLLIYMGVAMLLAVIALNRQEIT
jgi:ABC-type transport system involved in multi-copper enzyme maturation permease subunit